MQLGIFEMGVGDVRKAIIDYSSFLPNAPTQVLLSTVTVAVTAGPDVLLNASAAIAAGAEQAVLLLSGGSLNAQYTVTITATTSDGQVKNDTLQVLVMGD